MYTKQLSGIGCITRAECEAVVRSSGWPADCSTYPITCVGQPGGATGSATGKVSGGQCIDTNKQKCSVEIQRGRCPGGNNILWCSGLVSNISGGGTSQPTPAPKQPGSFPSLPTDVQTAGFSPIAGVLLGVVGLGVLFYATR